MRSAQIYNQRMSECQPSTSESTFEISEYLTCIIVGWVDNISYINYILYIGSNLTQETLTNKNTTREPGARCQKGFYTCMDPEKIHAFSAMTQTNIYDHFKLDWELSSALFQVM